MCTIDYALIVLNLLAIVAIGGGLSYYKVKRRKLKEMDKIVIR